MMQDLPAITEQLKQLDVDSLNTVLQGLPTLMDNVNKTAAAGGDDHEYVQRN